MRNVAGVRRAHTGRTGSAGLAGLAGSAGMAGLAGLAGSAGLAGLAGLAPLARLARLAGLAGLVLGLAGCELFQRPELVLPTTAEAEAAYAAYEAVDDVRLSGNVVEVHVIQPADQVRRGGSLWARLGPYIYLFSPATRELFREYNGLAAVRVVTQLPDGTPVARAMLLRDSESERMWQRSERLLSQVLAEGTQRPGLVDQLVQWGEQVTEYEYNPAYVPTARSPAERNP